MKVNHISGGTMFSLLTSTVVDRGYNPLSDEIKDHKIGICRFSVKQAALRRKSKDWLARNQDNVSGWSNMFTRGLVSVS